MKHFCVNGGSVFSFDIAKITSRDVRLLEKHYTQKECFVPDAERNLRAVQSICERLSKTFGTPFSTTVCLRSRAACVSIFLPLWNLRRDEWGLLQDLRPYLAGVNAYPFRFGLKIVFKIKYFGDEPNCMEKDLNEILQNYTDK